MSEDFTVPEALAWLGISWDGYVATVTYLVGRHGNPVVGALLDCQSAAQRAATTPEAVLAKHGIDAANPMEAAKRYDKQRERFDV